MTYVDGFVLVVKKKNLKAYQRMAQQGAKLWKKHGAIRYMETVANDLKTMPGTLSFKKLTKLKAGETVVFSYVTFKDKAHRDAVNKKIMKDTSMQEWMDKMPFDVKRMSYGGFHAIVEK